MTRKKLHPPTLIPRRPPPGNKQLLPKGKHSNLSFLFFFSAANKSRLKFATFLHFAMALLMLFRLSVAIFVMFGFRPPAALQKLNLPRATTWEFIWLVSVVPAIFGLIAIRKNNVFLMQQYLIGSIIFGLGSTVYAMYDLSDDFMDYWNKKQVGITFRGFPVIVLWAMFLTIAFQLHLFGIFFSYKLLKSWRITRERYKRK